MLQHRPSPCSRLSSSLFLAFFLLVPLQLQGCKGILTLLGGGVISYTIEKALDKVIESLTSKKPSEAAIKIDQASGKIFIKEQILVDSKTNRRFLLYNLTGTVKSGKFYYDEDSLRLIKEHLGDSLCPNNVCKVTNLSQK